MNAEHHDISDVSSNSVNNVGSAERISSTKRDATKVQYNPARHTINTNSETGPNKRYRKREKQKKEKRKAVEKEKDYLHDYYDLLLHNLLKEYYTTQSPHLVISRQWFFKIKNHSIMLKDAHEVNDNNQRKIYYEVDKIGKNVRYTQKDDTYVLNPSTTSRNTIYIVVRLTAFSKVKKLLFYTRLGHMIEKYNLSTHKDRCYVILSIIMIDKNITKMNPLFFEKDLPLMKRFYNNQITVKKGSYHFNTSGTIYGLGYGPKSNRNEFGHSVCKYANSKFSISF